MTSFEELQNNIIDWANEKGIIHSSEQQARAQLDKMKEEFVEFQEAFEEYFAVDYKFDTETPEYAIIKCNAITALDLELGDVMVTAIITGACLGTDPRYALSQAWEKIKNRKGKVVNGQFVKNEE